VERDSSAQEAGVLKGDLLLQIGAERITSLSDFQHAAVKMEKYGAVEILIMRQDKKYIKTLKRR